MGLLIKPFHEENDVDFKRYYYWLKWVRKEATKGFPTTLQDNPIVSVELSLVYTKQLMVSYQTVATLSVQLAIKHLTK